MTTVVDPAPRRLANHVRNLLALRDWNQRDLAEAAGVSLGTVNLLLNAKTKLPHTRTIRKLAVALNTTPQKILDAITTNASLPPEQQQLIALFVRKSRSHQQLVLRLLRALPNISKET
jgi:transcriptional regulator with XRE-family HTH domain